MINGLREQLLNDLGGARTQKEIEEVRVRYLGRKGLLARVGKEADFSNMSLDEKRAFGKSFNELLQFAQEAVEQAANAKPVERPEEQIDLTLPGTGVSVGNLHPVTLV